MRVSAFGGGRWPFAAALLGLVIALAAVARGRAPAPSQIPARVARPAEGGRPVGEALAAPPVDPAGIRDVFRFADESWPVGRREPATARVEGQGAAAPEPAGPRLVGLVRRAGRLMAALSDDGEVELAGPGDSVAGITVLSVGEDGVRVRRADGSEQTLALP
jgi:hypothetical protein